jgi:hypothetical protein
MSSFPKAFTYPISRLANFSRQRYRLTTQGGTTLTYGPNDQIIVDLPVGLLDMSTFTLHGRLSTSVSGGTTPGTWAPPIEMCFSDVYVEIGGVAVTNLNQYGNIFNVFRDMQLWDCHSYRRVLQNEITPGQTVLPSPTMNNVPVACWNWLGFLGTKVLDTTILPPVRLYLRLAPSSVLGTTGSPTSATYTLNNTSFTVDVMDLADGVYSAMIQQRLKSAPIEIPYDNYQVVLGAQGAVTSTRFSTSAHCVQSVFAWFAPTNWTQAVQSYVQSTALSAYFRRVRGNLTDSQFRINSVPYPAIPASFAEGEIFAATSHAMNLSQDTLGQSNPNLDSLTKFQDDHFVHFHSFCYDADGDDHRLSGLDARGNQLIGSWEANGASGSFTPVVVLKCKSILRIGAGKLVEQIL